METFKESIIKLGEKAVSLKEQILTEEATKSALVMPFIQLLGYDIFNPTEVVPEFVSDIGTKKGEKVDYAILNSGFPIILIECKHWKQNLDLHDGQLLRYFHVSKARFGVLTNGITYKFFTDLNETNKMDESPFLEFDIDKLKDVHIEELRRFQKNVFEADEIYNSASELKYSSELRKAIDNDFINPSPEFVKYFTKKVYNGVVTNKVIDKFTIIIKNTINQYISDIITDRLQKAIEKEEDVINSTIEKTEEISKVNTTSDEIDGFLIVKAILRQNVNVDRVFYRDAQTYFSIILDDNNRKPICRLHLNGGKKYISIFDENKNEIKKELNSLNDIFKHSDDLLKVVDGYIEIE